MTIGAPLGLNVTDDIIIVLERTSLDSSIFTLEYQISGEQFPFWEKPFLGEEEWLW